MASDADPILSGGTIPGTSATDVRGQARAIGGVASGGSTSGSFVATPYGAVLAPGGTIGARASTPAAQASSRTPTGQTQGARRKRDRRSGRRPGRNADGTYGPADGRPTPRGHLRSLPCGATRPWGGRNRSHADPNDPWAVAEGGPAVLEPAPEPTEHDPGPGVIGLDR